MYDQYGFYSENGMPQGGPGPDPGGPGMGFGGFDFSDFVNQQSGGRTDPGGGFGGGFRDIFSQMFGGRQQAQTAEKGADLEYALNIDFWQAIRGTQVKLAITRQEICATCNGSGSSGGNSTVCPECNGSGNVTQMAGAMKFSLNCPRCHGSGRLRNTCPTCHGEGRNSRSETVDVRIPPGAQTG
jgi:molecular chaperone DnaJ